MKKVLGVTLGILTAMGGFVDIGDIVANSATGARFGMSLAWAVVLGVGGIIVFAEMAGRVASVTHRAVFDLVRERLGARMGILEPRRVVLHHLAHPGRGGGGRGVGGADAHRCELPAVDPARGGAGVARHLAHEVLHDGDGLRSHGARIDRGDHRAGAARPVVVVAVAPGVASVHAER